MNATVEKKEERCEIAPGITQDNERIYFDPKKTDIGKIISSIKLSDIDESFRIACEKAFEKSK